MTVAKNQRAGEYRQIGCATRGGAISQATEDAAIALARKHKAQIIFVYVVDTSFAYGQTSKLPMEVVQAEIRNLGELILQQASLKAKEQGIAARTEVREGAIATEIAAFVQRHKKLDALVVGQMGDELHQHIVRALNELEDRVVDLIVVRPVQPQG